jgi:hypothetical protein
MNKNNFKYFVRLILNESLDKKEILHVIDVIDESVIDAFSPLEDGTAVLNKNTEEKEVYDFRLMRKISEREAEIVFDNIQQDITGDFQMEVTTSERYDLPEGEDEIDITAMRHNRWVSEMVSNGWRYGLKLNEEEKTDPRLRPYHELTEKIKNI